MSLQDAHRGYDYQDLLTGLALVDVLLGECSKIWVDQKLVEDDRFDDLTVLHLTDRVTRVQFKHTVSEDKLLEASSFTSDSRDLRLDKLVQSAILTRALPEFSGKEFSFRILLRDRGPVDPDLLAILAPANPDPGPFFGGFTTKRFVLEADPLWPEDGKAPLQRFKALLSKLNAVKREELVWFCERLVIEVECPAASLDLTTPDIAERHLLKRAQRDIGAGVFPNQARSPIDFCAALIRCATAARTGAMNVNRDELVRRTQLVCDFGAMDRTSPVDEALEVSRPSAIEQVFQQFEASPSKVLIVEGSPGQGKSWLCKQLGEHLDGQGWLVVEHYCYLGPQDQAASRRVQSEVLFGTLLARLEELVPEAVVGQRPRFSANAGLVSRALASAIELKPDRKMVLLIDGLDHVNRIPTRSLWSDPGRAFAEGLAQVKLPEDCLLIVLSQPGDHLTPLKEGAHVVQAPPVDLGFISEAAVRAGLVTSELDPVALEPVADKAAGNALYVTYILRELGRDQVSPAVWAAALERLPPFDGTLKAYYQYLLECLGGEAKVLADILGLLEFAVTRGELREIQPMLGRHVDKAIHFLAPVLSETASKGLRVYHESFGRFLREELASDDVAVRSIYSAIANWLIGKGHFSDARSFRFLFPTLCQAKRTPEMLDYIGTDYVARAISWLHTAAPILENLAFAAGEAAALNRWPKVVLCIELSRAANEFDFRGIEEVLIPFLDVLLEIRGADKVAEAMLFEGKTFIPAREALQLCVRIDEAGGVAPWAEYTEAFRRESRLDDTNYGHASDVAVQTAICRGALRLASIGARGPVDWTKMADWLSREPGATDDLLESVVETHGLHQAVVFAESLQDSRLAYLALASQSDDSVSRRNEFLYQSISPRPLVGLVWCTIAQGLDPQDLAIHFPDLGSSLLNLTQQMLQPSARWDGGLADNWFDHAVLAAHLEPDAIASAEITVDTSSWYRCWLRFVLSLVIAETKPEAERSLAAIQSLSHLTTCLKPFQGDPRACDLYPIHGWIRISIQNAFDLLQDSEWDDGLRILREVNRGISTTIKGELGGPVPLDFVLQLASDYSHNSNRIESIERLLTEAYEASQNSKFYINLAEFKLTQARTNIANGSMKKAEAEWREACILLAAYGWRREITIYGPLTPLSLLAKKDRIRSMDCLKRIQVPCTRVYNHTDGKDTGHVVSDWWDLAAEIDPVFFAEVAHRELLESCNDPYPLLRDAIAELWKKNEEVDVSTRAALRLTLESPLEAEDLELLRELSELDEPEAAKLGALLLCRADERHVTYSYSNGEEYVKRDKELVDKLNTFAAHFGTPPVLSREEHGFLTETRPTHPEIPPKVENDQSKEKILSDTFSKGARGFEEILERLKDRAWNSQNDPVLDQKLKQRFRNVVFQCFLEILEEGDEDTLTQALERLGEEYVYSREKSPLPSLAADFEERGLGKLAAIARATHWTTIRGRGGWYSFGGLTDLQELRRAVELDSQAALECLNRGVRRMIKLQNTNGLSQALIYAFSEVPLTGSGPESLKTAFECWEAAVSLIEFRTPGTDLPAIEYQPSGEDPTTEDVEYAFTLATFGGLAQACLEGKRRSYLAISHLLHSKTTVAVRALRKTLELLREPVTLSWLLALLLKSGNSLAEVIRQCEPELRLLAQDQHAVVRFLARTLSETTTTPSSENGFKDQGEDDDSQAQATPQRAADWHAGFLEETLGQRLLAGTKVLPALAKSTKVKFGALFDEAQEERQRRQARAFLGQTKDFKANLLWALDEVAERALQLAATEAIEISPLNDPPKSEPHLISLLADDPGEALLFELNRIARPSVEPPPGPGSPQWADLAESAQPYARPQKCINAASQDGLLFGNLVSPSLDPPPTLSFGEFSGLLLASHESRLIPNSYSGKETLWAERTRAPEFEVNGQVTALAPPGEGRNPAQCLVAFWSCESRLAGLRAYLSKVIVPSERLIELLNLSRRTPFDFEDEQGLALCCRAWRTGYQRSDYHIAFPTLCGSAIFIREDCLAKLQQEQKGSLVFRDFLIGHSDFVAPRERPTPRIPPSRSKEVYERLDERDDNIQALVSALETYDRSSVFTQISMFQLSPQNAGETLRMDILANAAAIAKDGQALAKRDDINRLVKLHLTDSELLMMRDPHSNRFVEEVGFGQFIFRCFPGGHDGGLFDFQQFIKAVFHGAAWLSSERLHQLQEILIWALVLSDRIAERSGLEAGTPSCPLTERGNLKQPQEVGAVSLCYFSDEELADISGKFKLSRENLVLLETKPDAGPWNLEEGPLHRGPIIFVEGGIIVGIPTALWVAARQQICTLIEGWSSASSLANRIALATVHTLTEGLKGMSVAPPSVQNGVAVQKYEFDIDKSATLIVTCDLLDEWDEYQVFGMEPQVSPRPLGQYLAEIGVSCDAKHNLIVLATIGVGRFGIAAFSSDATGATSVLLLRANEFQILSKLENGDFYSLYRFCQQYDKFREQTMVSPLNGLLDLYAIFCTHRTFYLSDAGRPDGLNISFDQNLDARQIFWDRFARHWVRGFDSDLGVIEVEKERPSELVFRPCRPTGRRVALWAGGLWFVSKHLDTVMDAELGYNVLNSVVYWWLALASRIELGPIVRCVEIDFETPIDLEAVEDDTTPIDSRVRNESKELIRLELKPTFFARVAGGDPSAEISLIHTLLDALGQVDSQGIAPAKKLLEELAKNTNRRLISVETLDQINDLTLDPRGLEEPRRVPLELVQEQLDEIGAFCSEVCGLTIGVVSDPVALLNKIVGHLFSTITAELRRFRETSILSRLISQNEALRQAQSLEDRRLPSELACFPDLGFQARGHTDRVSDLASAAAANRFLIEYVSATEAACTGEDDISYSSYDRLAAIALQLISFGQKSDLIHFGLTQCTMRLLPSGRLDLGFHEHAEKHQTFALKYHESKLLKITDSVTYQKSRWSVDALDPAAEEEWGYSMSDIGRTLYGLNALVPEDVPHASLDKEEAIREVAQAIHLEPDRVRKIFTDFTQPIRKNFLKPPSPFRREDTYPWRVQRPLSYLRRPLAEVGRSLHWGRRNLFLAPVFLMGQIEAGRLKAQSQLMKRFQGKVVQLSGTNFVREIAAALGTVPHLVVRNDVKKVGERRIEDQQGDLGDIDLLVLDPKKRNVWVLECKAYERSRAPHEIFNEKSKLMDEGGHIDKHSKRVKWVKSNLEFVLEQFGITMKRKKPFNVRARILVSDEIFSVHLGKPKIRVQSWAQFKLDSGWFRAAD